MHGQSQPNGVSINGIYPLNDGGEVQVKPGRKAKLSFEVFPAKTQEAVADLLAELRCLSVYNPEFISVTYGAGVVRVKAQSRHPKQYKKNFQQM